MVLGEGSEFLMLCWLSIKMGPFDKGNGEGLGYSESSKYLLGPDDRFFNMIYIIENLSFRESVVLSKF